MAQPGSPLSSAPWAEDLGSSAKPQTPRTVAKKRPPTICLRAIWPMGPQSRQRGPTQSADNGGKSASCKEATACHMAAPAAASGGVPSSLPRCSASSNAAEGIEPRSVASARASASAAPSGAETLAKAPARSAMPRSVQRNHRFSGATLPALRSCRSAAIKRRNSARSSSRGRSHLSNSARTRKASMHSPQLPRSRPQGGPPPASPLAPPSSWSIVQKPP
mmetsp:Transcript_103378/g.290887  ORF Transcript_103378/g.290887 Transcript_103378/m.290887 type:complete len:220 (+) Transcript_103378:129-788(+)